MREQHSCTQRGCWFPHISAPGSFYWILHIICINHVAPQQVSSSEHKLVFIVLLHFSDLIPFMPGDLSGWPCLSPGWWFSNFFCYARLWRKEKTFPPSSCKTMHALTILRNYMASTQLCEFLVLSCLPCSYTQVLHVITNQWDAPVSALGRGSSWVNA